MRIGTEIGKWCAAAMLAAICLAPASAFAESECDTNADCGEGFVCETVSTPCAAPPPCDSVDGGECPEPPECDPEPEGQCRPAPPESCDTASDCDAGLVCVTYTYETCSGGVPTDCASSEGGEESCPEPAEEPECTTETEGSCLPPYLAPCDVAADCGSGGWTCEAAEVCTRSGGGPTTGGGSDDSNPGEDIPSTDEGSDGSSGGEDGDRDEPSEPGDGGATDDGDHGAPDDCSCEPGDVKYCDLPKQECDSDSDCAGDLKCMELPGGHATSPDTTCTNTPDGETICEDDGSTENEEPASYCLPADIERWRGSDVPGHYGASDDESHSGGSNGGDTPGNSSDDDGRDVVAAEVDRGNGASADGGDATDDEGCGCASTSNSLPGSFAALFFALIGVAGFRRRSS